MKEFDSLNEEDQGKIIDKVERESKKYVNCKEINPVDSSIWFIEKESPKSKMHFSCLLDNLLSNIFLFLLGKTKCF